jgi:fucose permease
LPLDGTSQQSAARPVRWRNAAIWYCYLLLGLFTFILAIQGIVLPFLKARLHLSYGIASLHSSAIAAGMILVGLLGDRVTRRIGRGVGLLLGTLAVVLGCVVVAFAPSVWFSLGGSLLMGLGALNPTIVFAVLAGVPSKYRDSSYTESNALSYVFAIVAPLSMSVCLWLSIPWWSPLMLAAVAGILIAFAYRGIEIPYLATNTTTQVSLPPAFWAYWCCISVVVAIEFCVVLWAPTFLAVSAGLSPGTAAVASAAFSLAMLGGRAAGGGLVRVYPVRGLFVVALVVTLAGFAIYWGAADPRIVVPGLFVVGLGVALLYPLGLSLAMDAAGEHSDTASARAIVAGGLAMLLMPTALGRLADAVGLRAALLLVPGLALGGFVCLIAAEVLQRKAGDATG